MSRTKIFLRFKVVKIILNNLFENELFIQNEEEKYLNKCVRETSETKPTKAPTGTVVHASHNNCKPVLLSTGTPYVKYIN